MTQIQTLQSFGGILPTGIISIPYHVAPTVKVAGTDSITLSDIRKYNFFNVTSAAATSNITLGEDIPVGAQFILYVGSNGMELLTEGATDTMNGGTAAQVIDIAADSTAVILKTTADTYVVEQIVAAGTRTAPTPAVDG